MHADDFDFWSHSFDVVGHASDQTAAANGHKHRVDGVEVQALQLAQHFHGDGALARDDVWVVKRMDEGHAVLFLEFQRVLVGIGIAVTKQDHLAAQGLDSINLQSRRCDGHHDNCLRTQSASPQSNALRMVTSGGANHAFFELRGGEMRHLVVRATQFEAEHRLLVFALEQHGVVQTTTQVFCNLQSRLMRYVVNAGSEDFF